MARHVQLSPQRLPCLPAPALRCRQLWASRFACPAVLAESLVSSWVPQWLPNSGAQNLPWGTPLPSPASQQPPFSLSSLPALPTLLVPSAHSMFLHGRRSVYSSLRLSCEPSQG